MQTIASETASASHTDREITLTRVFDAPRALVFAAWTDPKHLQAWWGVKTFTTRTLEIDVRVGGRWRFVLIAPGGAGEWSNRVVFREIVTNERIVYDHSADVDRDPETFHVTATFTEQAGKTKLTFHSVFSTAAQLSKVVGFGAIEIGKQHLEGLAEYVDTLGSAR